MNLNGIDTRTGNLLDPRIVKLKELQKINYEATTPMDSYFTGFYNGIEYALSILNDNNPIYKSVENKE